MLKVKNLSVQLDGKPILERVSFEVAPGEIVVILGPNGAGKTTLLKALAGILPYEGEIEWTGPAPKIGFVPQRLEFQYNLPIKVKEIFEIILGVKNKNKILEYLEFAKAQHLLEETLSALSGGELQRVLISFVLAEEPSLLLFDEPMSGIDIGGEETIYQHLLHTVFAKKLTVIMVSHDLSVVFRVASKIICLNKTIHCIGKPQEIKDEAIQNLYGGEIAVFPHLHH